MAKFLKINVNKGVAPYEGWHGRFIDRISDEQVHELQQSNRSFQMKNGTRSKTCQQVRLVQEDESEVDKMHSCRVQQSGKRNQPVGQQVQRVRLIPVS